MTFQDGGSPARKLEDDSAERRRSERRIWKRFYFLDRRTGFDRRALDTDPKTGGPFNRLVTHLRRSPPSFLVLLLALNLLNLADYVCTVVALRSGVLEGNPFMAELFSQGPVPAARAKVALVFLVSALLWRFRRYRHAILAGLAMSFGFLVLFAYHTVGLAIVLNNPP